MFFFIIIFQVCEVLCKYCIDPKLRDQWNKTAAEYCRTKNDKRIPYLKKATRTLEEMNKRMSSAPLDSVEGNEDATGKKKKKKRKRNKKEKKEEVDEVIDEGAESDDKKEEVMVMKPPVKPVEPVHNIHNIQSLLVRVMSFESEYFLVSSKSANSSFQVQPDKGTENLDDTLWIAEGEDEGPVVVGRYSSAPGDPAANIDDQPWEVECTENILRFLKNEKCPFEIKTAAVDRITCLASGKWLPVLRDPVDIPGESNLYEAHLSSQASILWDVSIQFSAKCTAKDIGPNPSSAGALFHVFSEVIRIWDIVSDSRRRDSSIQHIVKSRERGLKANVEFNLLPQFLPSGAKEHISRHNLPKKFLLKLDGEPPSNSVKNNPYSRVQKYCPAASIRDDEFNVFVFYNFSSNLVSCMLGGSNNRRDFPFKEWPKEHDIINLPHNKEAILLVGRSGTGKTTCCLYRLWYQFCNYWEQAGTIGAWYPRRHLMLRTLPPPPPPSEGAGPEAIIQQPKTIRADSCTEVLEHLHQVFVTKNYVLCAQMKKRFYDMAASYPHLAYHLEYENVSSPLDLESVHSMAYPLFLTSRQFLLMLDASINVGMRFFPRNKDGSLAVKISSSDYDHENPDTLLDIEESEDEDSTFDEGESDDVFASQTGPRSSQMSVWREVTALYFINDIWPKISTGNHVDPLLVWMEIKSFIKGSAQALETPEGYLSEPDYKALGKKMASNFVGSREEMYKIFLRYENYLQKKRNLNLFDECQLVHNLYQRLVSLEDDPPWSIHNFYIDEVQDFTQAELSLYLRSCRDPNDLFLTGDTAQSIMRGISFRFSDLRSLFHYANDESRTAVHPAKIEVPVIHDLTINFRSHSGILQLAASVIDLMKKFFPNSFDLLPEDRGMFPGPLPIFLQSCQVSDLALLLQSNKRASSAIEFGAHQVIIVQNDQAKKSLPEVLKAGIVLTVFESKGLEFDDVLLYNFFSDSSVSIL